MPKLRFCAQISRRALCSVSFLLLSIGARSDAQLPPVAEWVSQRLYVLEGTRFVEAPIRLTGTIYSATSVQAVTSPGTAGYDDFADVATFALWDRFEPGVRTITFEALVDAEIESDESFFVDLSPSNNGLYELGGITQLEIVIVDDDGGIRPWFDAIEPFSLNEFGYLMYLTEQNAAVQLPVNISAPAPANYEVQYSIDGGPLQALAFVEGSTQAQLSVPAPTGAYQDYDFGVREIALVDPVSGKRAGNGPGVAVGGYSESVSFCVACLVLAVSNTLTRYGTPEAYCVPRCYPCAGVEFARGIPLDPVTIAQDYRDGVLAETESGQFYIQLYQDLSPKLALEVFRNPALLGAYLEGFSNWMPAFAALVAGEGDNVLVTQGMQDTLLRVMQLLEDSGDPQLVEVVTRERTRLSLDAITDLTMSAFQNRVETLGGQVAAKLESWGGLRARFKQ